MKKILSLVLVLSLVLGSFSMAFATPKDVEGTKYEDAVTRLAALEVLGGYDDGTFKPEKTITRAEFAKIMANIVGVGTAAEYAKGQTKFTDVPAAHWAAGYINVVSDMGIVNGYGNGNFGPEDQVTIAQAITMIVRSLGYTPRAEKIGGYPGGYIAIASEKDITDKITVVNALAATRGDVAVMVDTALTVDLMEQTTWGQYPEYKEVDKNLMTTKLSVDEFEGRVIAVPSTDDSLDDDELIISFENDKEKMEEETLTMKADIDLMTLFGQKVKVWAKDENVFFVNITSDDKDVIFDTVASVDKDEIELLVDDEKYDFDDEVQVYINFDEKKVSDIEKDMYGYVVLNKKDDVIAVNLFEFDTEGALVTKVDGEELEIQGKTDVDFDDYDDGIHIFDKNFRTIDKDEIAENSVVNYYTDSDEIWMVVVNDTVEGELESAKGDEVKVAGTKYDARKDMYYSLDNKDDIEKYGATEKNLKDLMDENAVVVLDINGDALFIYGDVKETSGLTFALYQAGDADFDTKIRVINAEGNTETYEFEDSDDFKATDKTALGSKNKIVAFELNKDGEIADGTFIYNFTNHDDYRVENTGKYTIDDDGYIERNNDRFYVIDDTTLYNVEDGSGDKLEFDSIKDADESVKVIGIVVEKRGNDVAAVVFENAESVAKEDMYGIVVDELNYSSNEYETKIHVAGDDNGVKDFPIDGKLTSSRKAEYTDGNILKFNLNTSDEIKKETVYNSVVTVTDTKTDWLKLNGVGWKKFDDDVVIYSLDDDDESDDELNTNDIDKNDKVRYVLKKDKIIALTKVTSDTPTGGNGGTGEITEGNMAFFVNNNEVSGKIDVNKGEGLIVNVKLRNTGDTSFTGTHKLVKLIKNGSAVNTGVTENINATPTVLAGKTVDLGTVTLSSSALNAAGEYTLLVLSRNNDTTPVKYERTIDIKVIASKDATLSGLSYETGSTTTAVPNFSAGTTSYTVQLPAGSTGEYTLVATKNSSHATLGTVSKATAVETDGSNEASITVTAEDTTSTKTYTVEFIINHAPTVVNSGIADQNFEVATNNPENVTVSVDGAFEDEEDSDLSYEAVVKTGTDTDSTVDSIMENGDELIIQPTGAAGTVTITVTATDEAGETATNEFDVTFTNP